MSSWSQATRNRDNHIWGCYSRNGNFRWRAGVHGSYVSCVFFFLVHEPNQWNSPSHPVPSLLCPQLINPVFSQILLLAWSALWQYSTRGQQRAAGLSRMRRGPLGQAQPSVLKDTQAGPQISKCANTWLHKLSLLSLTCTNWHHSYKSYCVGKWQDKRGTGKRNFTPTDLGGPGAYFKAVLKSSTLCSFASCPWPKGY